MVKLENSLLIRQSNAITESRHTLSATEQNIMYMLISQFKEDDPENKVYSIRVGDLDKLCNSQINYSHLKEASQKLIGKVYRIRTENETVSFAPLNFFFYKKNEAIIELKISDEIRPFFFALKNNYTRFQFQIALKLKSKYAKRIYEMLSQFKKTGVFKTSVQALKERFELIDYKKGKEEYKKFGSFATYVLEVARREINNHTDIKFDYVTKKTGRKITGLEFRVYRNESIKGIIEPKLDNQEKNKLGVKEMEEILVSQFKISKTLAKEVVEAFPIKKIEGVTKEIWKENEAGKITKLGAYCQTLFKSWLDGAELTFKKSEKYIPIKSFDQKIQREILSNKNLKKLFEEFKIEYNTAYKLSF